MGQIENLISRNDKMSLFDLLACTIHGLSPVSLRKMISDLRACTETKIQQDIQKFGIFYEDMHNSYKNQYQLPHNLILKITDIINDCFRQNDCLAIGHFIELADRAIGDFGHAYPYLGLKEKAWDSIVHIPPLNGNYKKAQLKIYPVVRPFWNMHKAEQQRALNINSILTNCQVIFPDAEELLTLDYFYLKSDLISRSIELNNGISIALSPVCDYAKLSHYQYETECVNKLKVLGLQNAEYVYNRVIRIFNDAFQKGFQIIAFPEVIGSRQILTGIQEIMKKSPDYRSLVFLPTFYEEGRNKEIVLGPNGRLIHEQHKITAFNAIQKGKTIQEDILPGDTIKILLVEGLGAVTTPICMDLLEREESKLLHEQITANTIICPSFSPGIQAFQDALAKGQAPHTLELWLNTCSAHDTSLFAHDYGFENIGMVHLPETPTGQETHRFDCMRRCGGICSEKLCYFNISLQYIDNKFHINGIHEIA